MKRPKRNPNHYKWGLFYCNPDDPSFFVDNQFGIGQSINFAHRSAWYLMLFIILFPVLVIIIPVLFL